MRAPVAVLAFNRPRHLEATLTRLAANAGAGETEVTVFCDGPRSSAEKELTDQVRAVARAARGFKRVTVIARDENFGLERSVITGISEVLAQSDRVIVVEDDIISAKYFLDFLNDGLEIYADDDRVASISGFAYPIGDLGREIYFLNDFECWGWAIWRRSWEAMNWNGAQLLAALIERGLEHKFDCSGAYPFTTMLRDQVQGKVKSWAVRARANVFLQNKFTLYPRASLVQNIGFDGSGTSRGGESEMFKPQNASRRIAVTRMPIEKFERAGFAIAEVLRREQQQHRSLRRKLWTLMQPRMLLKRFSARR